MTANIHSSVEMLCKKSLCDHNKNHLIPEWPPEETEKDKGQFGILKFNIDKTEPTIESILWVLTIDRSGSMGSICDDGNSKMDHIKHTLKNMLDYFNKFKNIVQKITLIIFDHEVEIILDQAVIDDDLIKSLYSIQRNMSPRGQTNIERAFKTVKENIPSNEKIIHVFMSDGKITSGSDQIEYLKSQLNTENCINVFVGYGCDHDALLMQNLSRIPNGDYYFIESLENAGFVYGEIVYNYFYSYISDLFIHIEDGLIYDYINNIWVDQILFESLPSGKERVWHIMATGDNFKIQCNYKIINSSEIYNCNPTISYPIESKNIYVEKYNWRQKTQELMAETNKYINDKANAKNLKKYNALTRNPDHYLMADKYQVFTSIIDCVNTQKWDNVQEYLDKYPEMIDYFSSHNYSDNYKYNLLQSAVKNNDYAGVLILLKRNANPNIKSKNGFTPLDIAKKNFDITLFPILQEAIRNYTTNNTKTSFNFYNKLNEFLQKMIAFMNENDLSDDNFMKNLCDDITICIFGLNSSLGNMYVFARSLSQGKQAAYNITNIEPLQRQSRSMPSDLNLNLLQRSPSSVYSQETSESIMRTLSQ